MSQEDAAARERIEPSAKPPRRHQSIVVKVVTGLELRNSTLRQVLWLNISQSSRTPLAVWTGLTEQQIKHKALVPNGKQLSAEGRRRAVVFQVGATGRLLNFF
jgi:hypothetical protein